MNIEKIGVMLCLAFQESEGPFDIFIKSNQVVYKTRMMKENIKILSNDPSIVEIDILSPIDDRRTKNRWTGDRRLYSRKYVLLY